MRRGRKRIWTARTPMFGDSLGNRFFEKFLEKKESRQALRSVFSIQKPMKKRLKT